MIQRLHLATGEGGGRELARAAMDEGPAVRPVRVTVSVALAGLTPEAPRHDGVVALWFADAAHLARFDARFDAPPGADVGECLVVDPIVVRGAAWLDRRWSDPGPRFKHLALARRAEGLSPAELSQRWRDHAGSARPAGDARPTPIPDEARGLAYVQDHPHPRSEGDWPYDAVTEVWFDDVDGLRRRIDWFATNRIGQAADDLFRQSWFLAVREEVVLPD